MDEIQLYVGLKIVDENACEWRIFHVSQLSVLLVKMHVDKRVIKEIGSCELLASINAGKISITEDQGLFVFDISILSESQLADYAKKKAFLKDVEKLYGPSYIDFALSTSKEEYIALYTKYGFSKTLANRTLLRWLQSGFQDGSWMDPRLARANHNSKKGYEYKHKTGRPTEEKQGIPLSDEVRHQFDYGIALYSKNKKITKKDAYANVLYRYYRVYDETEGSLRLLPVDQRPTWRQFYNYFEQVVSKPEQQLIKTSRDEFFNDHRLLFGFNRDSAIKPGYIVEVDALEVDINIVSTFNRQQNISRPIVYMMTDLYSHAIVAFHVGFDNNSMLGLSSLMMNLFDDKRLLFEAHGISCVDLEAWPSCFIPHEIRCDRGSDFASDKFEKICNDLDILRTLEHGATGSMKGLIEQSFRQFQQTTLPLLEHQGVILKRYDSNHKKEACLTLEQIYSLIVAFIIRHNRQYVKSFSLTKDMRKAGIEKTAISVWKFGVEHAGLQTPITPANYQRAIYHTMPSDYATFSREGIKFHGLIYKCNPLDDVMMKRCRMAQVNANKRNVDGKKLNSIEVHFDPRSIDEIYYLNNGNLGKFYLDSARSDGLEHITWEEYEDYLKERKAIDKESINRTMEDRIEHIDFILQLSEEAEIPTYADSRKTRDFRKIEKNETNFNNRVATRVLPDVKVEKEDSSFSGFEQRPSIEDSSKTDNDLKKMVTEGNKLSGSSNVEKDENGKWVCPPELCSFLDD